MTTLKAILGILSLVIIFNISKYNTYEVVYADADVVKVNRKGEILRFPNMGYFAGEKKGNTVTLYGDYDWNWSPLSEKNFK